jgi:myo-inositol-1(or 4)-monophosphatase
MDEFLRHRINVGRAVVREQVAFFRSLFAKVESDWKEDHSRVTFADFAISEKILAELALRFPEDDLCSEEGDPSAAPRPLKARYAWILDPVDGTNNFALGMPMCAISLGLMKNGVPIYGFLYDYGRDRLTEGGPGLGLLDGEEKAKKFDPARPFEEASIVGLAFPLQGPYSDGLHKLASNFHIRCMGTGAITLTYVALGIIDGCIDFRSKAWDVAAALAFCQASGVKVCYLDDPHFPLKTFDVHAKSRPFYAGTEAFCAACEAIFAASVGPSPV